MHRVVGTAALLALLLGAAAPRALNAQTYPSKPIRMIVTLPAGSLTDRVGRFLAVPVSQAWGQPIVVDNRVGANGSLGMEACSKSAPDGYTLCMPDGNVMTLNPYAYAKLPYDPLEFVPVIHIAELEQSIIVQSSLPVKSMRELIDYARARPGQVTFGSAGAGSTMHLYLEWIQAKTGVRFNHIPYKGTTPLVQAMAAGEVDVTNLTSATAAQQVKTGKLRFIAIIAGERRTPFGGDTPSFASQGFELDFRNWLAFFYPKGTPNEFVRRWNTEVNRLLSDKAVAEKLTSMEAITLTGGTPEDLAGILERKRKVGAELARMANLKYD